MPWESATPRLPARDGPATHAEGSGEGWLREAQTRSLLTQPILLLFGAELGKDRNFKAQIHFPKSLEALLGSTLLSIQHQVSEKNSPDIGLGRVAS